MLKAGQRTKPFVVTSWESVGIAANVKKTCNAY